MDRAKHLLFEGDSHPQYITPDPAALLDYVVNFQTRPDDVILVSYPKSGKTILIIYEVFKFLETR